ncbi:MAG: thioredoxin family protein [Anaerobutyricum soehngenii]
MAIINLTKETFKQQISEVDKPVIVDFWAPWCTYCRRIAPAFDKIASQQEDKLIFAKSRSMMQYGRWPAKSMGC